MGFKTKLAQPYADAKLTINPDTISSARRLCAYLTPLPGEE